MNIYHVKLSMKDDPGVVWCSMYGLARNTTEAGARAILAEQADSGDLVVDLIVKSVEYISTLAFGIDHP